MNRSEQMEANNMAAIREALKKLVDFLRWEYAQDYPTPRDKLADAIDIGVAALSAPPRNCDVGTGKEQTKRYHATGQLYHTLTLTDALTWAQMPYEGYEK